MMGEATVSKAGAESGCRRGWRHLLEGIANVVVQTKPYPHVVIPNALIESDYRQLEEELPGLGRLPERYRNRNNQRVDLVSSSGHAELPLNSVSRVWRDFLSHHASEKFVSAVLSLFSAHMPALSHRLYQEVKGPAWKRALYKPRSVEGGRLFSTLRPLTSLIGTDWLNDFESPLGLDLRGRATLSLNTPVVEPSSVRGPHVDAPHKCYVGLFYLRHPRDCSAGAELQLYRWKPGRKERRWAGKIDPGDVDIIKTIAYAPNTYVLFLNTDNAIHGVSVRSESGVPRYLVVTSGWFASAPARVIGEPVHGEGKGVHAR